MNYLKKIKDFYSSKKFIFKTILAAVISILVLKLLVFSINYIAARDTITIIPSIQIFLLILICTITFIILFSNVKKYIENNQGVVNLLLVILTIIFTFSTYLAVKINDFYNTNTLLLDTEYINLSIVNSYITNYKDSNILWEKFITSPYEQNLPFISKNYPLNDCPNKIVTTAMEMDTVNEITTNTTQNMVLNNLSFLTTRNKEILSRMNKIEADLKDIIANCYFVKDGKQPQISFLSYILKP